MSCRSTPANSAILTMARRRLSISDQDAQALFHQFRREGAGSAPPSPEQVVAFLGDRLHDLAADHAPDAGYWSTDAQRQSVHDRLETAFRQAVDADVVPDGPTFHTWQASRAKGRRRRVEAPTGKRHGQPAARRARFDVGRSRNSGAARRTGCRAS